MIPLHFEFDFPQAFLLFFFILGFLFLKKYFFSRKQSSVLAYSTLSFFQDIPKTWRERLAPRLKWLYRFGIVFLILALARPQMVSQNEEIEGNGIDMLLVLDTSGSMKALDFTDDNGNRTNRLEVIKKVVKDFVRERLGDKIGMVVFGDSAFTQCPLTLDRDILQTLIDSLSIGMAGDGTAIGNALALGVKRLEKGEAKSKVLILLTDGRSNAGEIAPETAAEIARDHHIKVYTVGVGSQGRVPFPQETPFGTQIGYAELDLDEETLTHIAEITGGKYFRATDTDKLKEVYQDIDQLEKSKITRKNFRSALELYPQFLVPALLLIAVAKILEMTLFLTPIFKEEDPS